MVFLRVSTDKVSILQSQNDPVTQSIKTGPASKLDNRLTLLASGIIVGLFVSIDVWPLTNC